MKPETNSESGNRRSASTDLALRDELWVTRLLRAECDPVSTVQRILISQCATLPVVKSELVFFVSVCQMSRSKSSSLVKLFAVATTIRSAILFPARHPTNSIALLDTATIKLE